MLERYFFPVFPVLIILMFLKKRYFWGAIIINLMYFINLIWAFYRRTNGIIDNLFSDNNFLFIRLTSLVVVSFTVFLYLNIYPDIKGIFGRNQDN